jgi:hypothetical protein
MSLRWRTSLSLSSCSNQTNGRFPMHAAFGSPRWWLVAYRLEGLMRVPDQVRVLPGPSVSAKALRTAWFTHALAGTQIIKH